MKRRWDPEELVEYWTLLPDELSLVGNKTGATRLGFAILLKAFQLAGRFPQQKRDIPPSAIGYVAKQVRVAGQAFATYDWTGCIARYHRAQIREFFLPETVPDRLDTLLEMDSQAGTDTVNEKANDEWITWYRLKADPGAIGLQSLLRETAKLDYLRQIELLEGLVPQQRHD